MRVKLYNAIHEHTGTYAVWEKNFAVWLDESADTFFAAGGHAQIWNHREAFCHERAVRSRRELRCRMKALAA
jgi:hypothetical protein